MFTNPMFRVAETGNSAVGASSGAGAGGNGRGGWAVRFKKSKRGSRFTDELDFGAEEEAASSSQLTKEMPLRSGRKLNDSVAGDELNTTSSSDNARYEYEEPVQPSRSKENYAPVSSITGKEKAKGEASADDRRYEYSEPVKPVENEYVEPVRQVDRKDLMPLPLLLPPPPPPLSPSKTATLKTSTCSKECKCLCDVRCVLMFVFVCVCDVLVCKVMYVCVCMMCDVCLSVLTYSVTLLSQCEKICSLTLSLCFRRCKSC